MATTAKTTTAKTTTAKKAPAKKAPSKTAAKKAPAKKAPAKTTAKKVTTSAKPTAAATSGPTSDSVANPINLVGDEPDIDMSVYETPHERLEHELHLLPPYVRSLLRVKVKVSVCLASTRTKLSRVVDIGPGSIIQFDKNCEAPLTVEVAGIEVAQGEAVKIGDKFGLRVESIVLPPERFAAMPKRRSA